MAEIPRDILIDILLQFPVKVIVRFRCVSKSICILIDSNFFNKLLLRARRNCTTTLVVRGSAYSLSLEGSTYSLSLDSSILSSPIKHQCSFTLNGMSRMGSPYYPYGTCEGSCDGLVCMSNGDGIVTIWNPSTGNYIKSPDTYNIAPLQVRHVMFGIGYDSVHDEYKVVRIVQGCYKPFETATTVFSAKTGSWRRVCDFPYRVVTSLEQRRPHGVFACGRSHWIVTRKYYDKENIEYFIAAFDFASEEYSLMPLPRFWNNNNNVFSTIGVLEDGLYIMCHLRGCGADLYIMKEYGVKESWSKLCSVPLRRHRMYDFLRPLAYSLNRREILFVGDRILFWFDLENEKSRVIVVPRDWHCYGEDWHCYGERDVEVCGLSVLPVGIGDRIF